IAVLASPPSTSRALSPLRTRQIGFCPSARSSFTTARPVLPVAPITAIVIAVSCPLLARVLCRSAGPLGPTALRDNLLDPSAQQDPTSGSVRTGATFLFPREPAKVSNPPNCADPDGDNEWQLWGDTVEKVDQQNSREILCLDGDILRNNIPIF